MKFNFWILENTGVISGHIQGDSITYRCNPEWFKYKSMEWGFYGFPKILKYIEDISNESKDKKQRT